MKTEEWLADSDCQHSVPPEDEFREWCEPRKECQGEVSEEKESLRLNALLSKLSSYDPTCAMPFIVDQNYADEYEEESSDIVALARFLKDYGSDKQVGDVLYQHQLVARCYIRGSPMFARPIWYLYSNKDALQMPQEIYNAIWRNYQDVALQ